MDVGNIMSGGGKHTSVMSHALACVAAPVDPTTRVGRQSQSLPTTFKFEPLARALRGTTV